MIIEEESSEIPLGKDTQYPRGFDAGLLYAIPRNQARATLGITKSGITQGIEIGQELPFVGYDEWTLYELSWLDLQGSAQVAIGLLRVPADSEFIVESKSLKLYANGLYYKQFDSSAALIHQVINDLNTLLNCQVQFSLIDLTGLWSDQSSDESQSSYQSIDHHSIKPHKEPNISALSGKKSSSAARYQTQRFRSLCPVTGQPDWASIYIHLKGVDVETEALAQYLAGFSEHQGFHENCVERIYIELKNKLAPTGLSVAARYTRRGGIDINPLRASSSDMLSMPQRALRQ